MHSPHTAENKKRTFSRDKGKVIFYFPLLGWSEEKKQHENCGFYCLSSASFSLDLMSHKICLPHCISRDEASCFFSVSQEKRKKYIFIRKNKILSRREEILSESGANTSTLSNRVMYFWVSFSNSVGALFVKENEQAKYLMTQNSSELSTQRHKFAVFSIPVL